MINIKRKAFLISIATITCLLFGSVAYAAPGVNKVGGLGINSYGNDSSSCFGDRAGASYVDKLFGRMPSWVTRSYTYKNNSAYPSRMTGATKVDLFTFSGHGVAKSDYNTAHFYKSSSSGSHIAHGSGVKANEVSTGQARFTHAYVSMYSCNWMNFGTDTREVNFWKTFSTGCRIQCGFGSTMYLDSREGNMFGYRMVDYVETIRAAFSNSAKNYQPTLSGTATVRVAFHKKCKDDTFYSGYTGSVTSYSSNNSNYAYNTWYVS